MLRKHLPVILLACALGSAAEPPAAPQGRIVSIRFEPEQQPLTPEQLAAHLPVKVNDTLDVGVVRNTIQSLYSTGRYEDIQIAGLRQPQGMALIIRTRERRFVGGVDVVDKVKLPPSRNQMITATALNLGQPFSDIDLQNAIRNLQNLLRRNGYYESADIQPDVKTDPKYEQAEVTFTVTARRRAHYTDPEITGKPVLDMSRIIRATKWKHRFLFGWKPVTQPRTQRGMQGIRKLFADKDRLMAEVRILGMDYDPATHRLKPRLYIMAGPKVTIRTVGAKVSKGTLKKYVPVFDEGTVDRDLIVEGEHNLRDYFQIKGYFDVEVDFQERQKSPDEEEIVYTITRGQRQKLAAVMVHGNRYFPTGDIRERMYLRPGGFIRLRHGRFSDGFVRRDESSIQSLYQSNGFRDVKVRINRIDDYKGKDDEIAAVVNIDEGPQYRVSQFRVDGISKMNPNGILPQLASVEGQPFSETNVAMDRDFILRTYQAAGYPDARFDWNMKPGAGPDQVQVEYRITEGKERFIRDVVVSGNRVTSERLLKPIMTLQPGQPLSMTSMGKVQQDMYQLGVFDSVDMAIQNPDGDTENKYVLYRLDEGHRYYVAAGFGAELARIGGSTTSYANPGGQTGFSPEGSLEVSRMNMFGLGHSLNFRSKVSTLERRAVLDYSAPRYHNVEGRNITVSALYDDTRDVRTFTAKRFEGSAQLSQRLSKATTALWRFSYRRVSVDVASLKIQPEFVPQLAAPVRVGMPSTSFIQDHRDNPTDSHRGFYNTIDMGVSSKYFGSQRSFGRILARNSTYHPFGNSEVVLARSLQVGWLAPFAYSGLTEATAVPLPERFFGGGSTSHRGFPDNQAGPRDPVTGFPVGGNALFFHNTELRFPFIGDNINGVLFHDMGNIFSTMRDISFRVTQHGLTDFNYMVHAVGFGIRYHTPVGPVRVDLAYSINPPRFYGFQGTQDQLLFGTGTKTVQSVSHFQFFFSIGQTF